jgi:hypothetical protein
VLTNAEPAERRSKLLDAPSGRSLVAGSARRIATTIRRPPSSFVGFPIPDPQRDFASGGTPLDALLDSLLGPIPISSA